MVALENQPVRVRVVPDFLDLAMSRATIEDFNGLPLVGLRDPAIDGFDRVIKRVFDLAISTVTLLVTWPIMLAIAVAIKLEAQVRHCLSKSALARTAGLSICSNSDPWW